jgi:hypothetical protein
VWKFKTAHSSGWVNRQPEELALALGALRYQRIEERGSYRNGARDPR